MINKQHSKTVVWIASGRATPEEQVVIDKIGNCSVMNAKFFSTSPSESTGATRVYNLSGRTDIDEFYDDILVKEPVVIPASIIIEEKEEPEAVKPVSSKSKAQATKRYGASDKTLMSE
jgi:hypothetical protein